MKVAVIGDYESTEYKELLKFVTLNMPEEKIIDLSRHQSKKWERLIEKRLQDITDAHQVVVCEQWREDRLIDVKVDLGNALELNKDILQKKGEKLIPFNENYNW